MGDQTQSSRFIDKLKKDPMVPIGLIGFSAIVSYGLYNFRKRKMASSLYLINLRLAAQGTVIGCLTLGILYSISENAMHKFYGEEKKKKSD